MAPFGRARQRHGHPVTGQKTESNGVFAVVPAGVADRLRESFRFYDWDEAAREVRWMCSFDTSEDDIDAFVAAIRQELAAHDEGRTAR